MKRRSPECEEVFLAEGFRRVIDEIVTALQREAGMSVTIPPSERSQAAVDHGFQRQKDDYPIWKVAMDFGSISMSVGELGSELGLSFSANEYRVFNESIDTAIATAIEEFWVRDRKSQDAQTTERVGFLVHELRNALSSGKMAFQIVRSGQAGINGRTGDVLERSLRRLEDLVSQTLLSVQLSSAVQPVMTRITLKHVLESVVDGAVPERGVRVSLEADAALTANADERLLVSAVSNILQNALKFTRPGGTIAVRAFDAEGAVIEIEDECGGLRPGIEAEMFATSVRRSTDRRGLGLGLSITREAVEAMGGAVGVRDVPGKGCVFSIRLRAS